MTTPTVPADANKPNPKRPHPGYDEEQPRTPGEARQPPPAGMPHPEEGGLDRDATADPDPAEDA